MLQRQVSCLFFYTVAPPRKKNTEYTMRFYATLWFLLGFIFLAATHLKANFVRVHVNVDFFFLLAAFDQTEELEVCLLMQDFQLNTSQLLLVNVSRPRRLQQACLFEKFIRILRWRSCNPPQPRTVLFFLAEAKNRTYWQPRCVLNRC